MFDKNKFAQILKNINETYNSQRDFSKKSGINRTYLSQYMNMKLDEPPTPKILEKLANASNGLISYTELMTMCGYSEETLESKVSTIYKKLKKYHKYINNEKSDNTNSYELEGFIEDFQQYIEYLIEDFHIPKVSRIYISDIFTTSTFIEDYKFVAGFLLIYNEFLKLLESENYIDIIQYNFIDCFSIEDIYNNLGEIEHLELLSTKSQNIIIKSNTYEPIQNFVNSFSRCLSLAHISEFDNNSLISFFKKKAESSNSNLLSNATTSEKKYIEECSLNNCCMLPVYGQISAGQPNWAEECIDGYLPIDPEMMGIINPEEHYFLRVNGESMNKIIKNGAFALIHKQDIVENGEIAVVLVNGYDATLKKFTKQGDLILLEPQSNDESFTTQVYDKNTRIQIIGKYVGKMEINN